MTVSRVVNRSGPVSEGVRQRVQEAIAELGYTPNRLARGLRSNRTHTVALVVSDITNPFFTTLARGVEDAASERDNLVLLCNTDESEAEELRYLEMLSQQAVDGVLLVPARSGRAAYDLAKRRNLPLVMLDRRVELPDISVVRGDSYGGAEQMGRFIYEQGHREIAILAGPMGVTSSDDRVAGVLNALRDTDAHVSVIYGKFSPESGYESVQRVMGSSPRPTVLFALNNFSTIGALQGLYDLGLSVPEDVALVGYDEIPKSMVAIPFLTVVAQPAYELGRQGVIELLEHVESADREPREIVMPTELIIRRSIGKLDA